jgi:Protein of unknown function (DUF3500)
MADQRLTTCPECGEEVGGLTRRDFLKGVSATAAAACAGAVPAVAAPRAPLGVPKPAPETLVKRLYESLRPEQQKVVCLPWDHAARTRINANWAITKPTIAEFFTGEQQDLIRAIFRGVTSEEGYQRFLKQMGEDYGGFDRYHVAIFGKPGDGDKFQWVMTGRHLTIRCDGAFEDGKAFGGPMIYGHGTGDSEKGMPGNVFYYQTLRANEVFAMLDGKQRAKALLPKAPPEAEVQLRGRGAPLPGIPVAELSADQKKLAREVMGVLLAPYREADVKEALGCLEAGGGFDGVHLAFYKDHDIGSDQIWDIWRLEGPTFVWHFRGAPHVHTYVNIASQAKG